MRWMEENYYYLKDIPANKIIVPGTHCSASYKISKHQNISPSFFTRFLMKMGVGMKLTRKMISKWILTQELCILEQLENGVRYLDLDIGYDNKKNNFYITHTFALTTLANIMYQIKEFLDNNMNELLFITIKPDSSMIFTNKHAMTCMYIIDSILGNSIVKNENDGKFPTYGELVDNGNTQRVFIFIQGITDHFWNYYMVQTPHKTSYDINEIYEFNLESMEKLRELNNDKSFNIINFAVTPNRNIIFNNIFASNKITTNLRLTTIDLHNKFNENQDSINVDDISCITADYINKRFITFVINFNLRKANI
jgi:hypothetical protein